MTTRRLWVVEVWSGKGWEPRWPQLTREYARDQARRLHPSVRYRVVSYEPSR